MRHAFILTLIALAVASPAQAHFALFHRPVQTRAFYVPIAVVVTPVPAPAVRVPCPEPLLGSAAPVVAPAPPAATPLPSPPSSGPLRPTPAPQPRSSPPVNEGAATSAKVSTSFYEALPTANAAAPRAGSLFSVTFWNLSNTPLSLHVAGQMRTLNRGQRWTLELDREFAWQVEGRETQVSRVPAGEPGLTVLIRR